MSLMKLTQKQSHHLPSALYIWGLFFLLLTSEISIVPFPPKHPQCLHIGDLMLYHNILDNKGQEYYRD